MTDVNKLREEILTEFQNVYKLAPADYTENCTNVVMSLISAHIEAAVREARLDTGLDTIRSIKNILTGSEDFRIGPGVQLNLSIGQIKQIRDALENIGDSYIAQLQDTKRGNDE